MKLSLRGPSARTLSWIFFFLVAAIVFGLRLHTVNQIVVDWDESVYLVVAQDLLDGGSLYQTAWDHKGPLLYLTLAPVVSVADGRIEPVRLFTSAWLVVSMLIVFLIARRLGPPERAFIAPLVYGLFFSVPRFGGLASNAELFMMLPAAAAVWAGVRWIDGRHNPALRNRTGRKLHREGCLSALATKIGENHGLVASGFFTGVAILYKPTAVFTAAVVPLLILAYRFQGADRDRRRGLVELSVYTGATLAVSAASVAAFALVGTVRDFLAAVLTFNRAYVAAIPFGEAWNHLAAFFGWAVFGDFFTFLAVMSGLFLLLGRRSLRSESWQPVLLGGMVVLSLAGVCLGRNLFFHYYLQMALPIALVIGSAAGVLRISRVNWRRLAAIGLVLGLLSAFSPHRSDAGHHSRTPEQDHTLLAVAEYLTENGRPADQIFVLGGEPIVYFLAHRSAPTKYFFWLFHAERWDTILGSQRFTLQAFQENPPEWFVYRQRSPRVPELERFMFSNYQPVNKIGDYEIARLIGR